jgi:hypothetical protein
MDAEYPMNYRNPHFQAVADAQAARMSVPAPMPVMNDDAIKTAFDAMTPDDAYAFARELLMIAAKRQQAETTERAVSAAREGMGAGV